MTPSSDITRQPTRAGHSARRMRPASPDSTRGAAARQQARQRRQQRNLKVSAR